MRLWEGKIRRRETRGEKHRKNRKKYRKNTEKNTKKNPEKHRKNTEKNTEKTQKTPEKHRKNTKNPTLNMTSRVYRADNPGKSWGKNAMQHHTSPSSSEVCPGFGAFPPHIGAPKSDNLDQDREQGFRLSSHPPPGASPRAS